MAEQMSHFFLLVSFVIVSSDWNDFDHQHCSGEKNMQHMYYVLLILVTLPIESLVK